MYRFSFPRSQLQPYIENYWSLQSAASQQLPLQEAIFVDGKADLIFNFGVSYERASVGRSGTAVAHSNLDGQRDYPVAILQAGAINLVGVRFQAGGLSAFLPMPLHEIRNEVVNIKDALGIAAVELEARLYVCANDFSQQVALLDRFFTSALRPSRRHALVQAISVHLSQPETVSIKAISREFGYSVRTVDRFFQETIGFPPKTYARILRLQRVLQLLYTGDITSLAEIAFQTGYYDQAHFTRDFKAFTGQTPAAFQAQLARRRSQPPPNLVQFIQDARPISV